MTLSGPERSEFDASKNQNESKDVSQNEYQAIVDGLNRAREEEDALYPEDLINKTALDRFYNWCQQDPPLPLADQHRFNLDKTMAFFRAGFRQRAYLEELLEEFLAQDYENAVENEAEPGMFGVIKKIARAIADVTIALETAGTEES